MGLFCRTLHVLDTDQAKAQKALASILDDDGRSEAVGRLLGVV